MERRLAAIMAADVAGYSRMMGEDEEGTLAALKAIRRELADPKIAEHRGRIVKTTGDGVLVEFASVVDAMRCAAEVQRAMAERNAGVSPAKRIEFRIGIHQGDIIIDEGDIFGDGVNLAARLEGLADPGGVCVSRVVRDEVRDKLDVSFDDLGEQQVKNIARPVRAFAVRFGPQASRLHACETQAVQAPLALPDKPSLAVLPFQNMSGDPEQEYFADGMVEEITTAIARLPWLFVIARNSAFTYKGKAVDVKQVARELGVRYVLEGSVRKGGNRVRITGQLIDAATGNHIWADRFDGALDDIFDLQDQVASSVVGAIEPRLRQSEIERAARKPTASLDAYDLYLRALAQTYRHTEESFGEAVLLARQALVIDPSYAPAAAMVGWCRMMQRVQGWGALSDEDVAEGVRLARQALEGERDDPDTIWQAAYTLFFLAGETTMAEAMLDRALAVNPNAALAWVVRGNIHALRNRPEAAIEACDRARRLSPFDPFGYMNAVSTALAHLAARRFEQAIEWADRTLHDQPRFATAFRVKAVANAHLGRLDEARADLGRLLAIDPRLTIAAVRVLFASAAPEFVELYVTGLRLAGLPEE
ncbi:MAG TPA: adenylate/guanylate cyclase domain-containing protein [Stellaceae bacterium]